MRVLTFSKTYPAYHPERGQETQFVEKILKSLYPNATYYPCACEKCGWVGMSVSCEGGGAIADTGDYSDPICQKCYSNKLEGDCSALSFLDRYYLEDCGEPKHHTIRAGHRWKAGEWFSPRIWSGKPYASKQIEFAPPIMVKKVWDFMATTENDDGEHDWSFITLNDKHYTCYGYGNYDDKKIVDLAKNDGLSIEDFYSWIIPNRTQKQKLSNESAVFSGQIICWNDSIEY